MDLGTRWIGNDTMHWEGQHRNLATQWDKATGVYTLEVAEPRTDRQQFYRFRAPGHHPVELAWPEGREPQTIDVVLEPAPTTIGKVVALEDGGPLAGVTVAVVSPSERLRPGTRPARSPRRGACRPTWPRPGNARDAPGP